MENYDMFDNEVEKENTVELNRSRKGDLAEHKAVTWLWEQGYEVFLNCGCSGPIDIVAYKDGECTLVDVKTLHNKYKTGQIKQTRTEQQVKYNVRFLGFHPKTRKLRWINHKDTA